MASSTQEGVEAVGYLRVGLDGLPHDVLFHKHARRIALRVEGERGHCAQLNVALQEFRVGESDDVLLREDLSDDKTSIGLGKCERETKVRGWCGQ